MGFLIGDGGFFRKRIADINTDSRDFRNTKGNCKHFGAKMADIWALGVTVCFFVPLLIDIFNKDSRDDSRNNNGRTRKR